MKGWDDGHGLEIPGFRKMKRTVAMNAMSRKAIFPYKVALARSIVRRLLDGP